MATNTRDIPAYDIANLSLTRDIGDDWQVSASINNLFDEDYFTQPGFPMPGRHYSVGLFRSFELK